MIVFFKYYLSKMQVTPTENGKVFPSIMKILSRQSSVKFDVWFCIFSWHHDYGLLGNNGTWKDVETVISSFISPGNSHFPNINDYMDYDHLVFQRDFNSPFKREEVERTVDLYKCLDTYFNNTELHPFSDRESTWMFKRGVYDGLTEDSFHLQLGILELHRLFLRELEKPNHGSRSISDGSNRTIIHIADTYPGRESYSLISKTHHLLLEYQMMIQRWSFPLITRVP